MSAFPNFRKRTAFTSDSAAVARQKAEDVAALDALLARKEPWHKPPMPRTTDRTSAGARALAADIRKGHYTP